MNCKKNVFLLTVTIKMDYGFLKKFNEYVLVYKCCSII